MLVETKWKWVGSESAVDVCKSSNRSGMRKKCECKILYKHQNVATSLLVGNLHNKCYQIVDFNAAILVSVCFVKEKKPIPILFNT